MGIPDGIEHSIRSSQIDQDTSDTEHQNENSGEFRKAADWPPPFRLEDAKDGRDECPGMTDSYEEYEVRNIDPPEDLPRKSGDSQSGAILGEVRIKSQKNKGDQDGNGDIKTFSCLPDMVKQDSVFSNDLCLLV